jgi:hypothetical protein
MKFPFGKKSDASAKPVATSKVSHKTAAKSSASVIKPAVVAGGRKQVISGLVFVSVSFVGAVFLLYLTVNAQSAKDSELQDLNAEYVLVSSEKEVADSKVQTLQSQVGRFLDRAKVMDVAQSIHGQDEADRREGSFWIDHKSGRCMITLGVLNGVDKGSRLGVYDGENKIATVNVISALDVVSFVEPVDKTIKDFKRDYYHVKLQ